jgi:cell division septal protein FtsQ
MRLDRKIEYNPNKYANPFFRKSKSWFNFRFRFNKNFYPAIFFLLIIFSSIIWLLFFTTIFNLKMVEIEGANRISKNDIESLVWQETSNKVFKIWKWSFGSEEKLFFFNKEELSKKINENFYLDSVVINKKIPSTLIINIVEKQYSMVWQEGDGGFYFIDNNGLIIKDALPEEIKANNYPVIINKGSARLQDKKIDIDQNTLDSINIIFKNLKTGELHFIIDNFILDDDVGTIKMKIKEGPIVYFSAKNDINKQINKFIVVMKEKIKSDFSKKKYIDLRYGDMVYFQ